MLCVCFSLVLVLLFVVMFSSVVDSVSVCL